jgi:hypothetical protein
MPMARLTSGLKGRAFRRAVNPSKPAGFSRRGNSFSMPPGFEFPLWLLRAAEGMSYPTVEAPGFSPAKSRDLYDGFSRGKPGLKPVSYCPSTARLKAVPFHRIRALFIQ